MKSSKENFKDHLYALIVAGGGGTRLWPKSREDLPKQFLKLFSHHSLIQITAHRFSNIMSWDRIYVSTVSNAYKKRVLKDIPQIPTENVIVEPMRKNTAAGHGIGACYIFKKDPDAVIINEYADHLVKPESLYYKTLLAAAEVAYGGDWIVAVGVNPTFPGTGYEHIKKGKKFGVFGGLDVFEIEKFIERPDLETAKKFNASGNYFWNAGQYIWRADTLLKSMRIHERSLGKAMTNILSSLGTRKEKQTILSEYRNIPDKTVEGKPMSVDFAVTEQADNVLFLIAGFSWTDIGDWSEVWNNLPKDKDNNVIIDGEDPGGSVINVDTSNTIVHTDGKLIAIVDVDDIAIIDTKDALLVCKRSQAQSVKKIVEKLKLLGRKELL